MAMSRWLQWLVGAAAFCIVAATVVLIVLLAFVLPGLGDRTEAEIDSRLDEIIDELESSIGSAMEPTRDQIDELDDSLSSELRTIREKIERLEGKLEAVEELLDEINIRDAEAFRLRLGD